MTAGEYMTPAQLAALKASWDEAEYVLRESVGAPDWARFLDREGTAYSIEALAEEWLQGGVWADAGDWMTGPDVDTRGRWTRLEGVPVTREGFKEAARRVLALAVCDGDLWGLAA